MPKRATANASGCVAAADLLVLPSLTFPVGLRPRLRRERTCGPGAGGYCRKENDPARGHRRSRPVPSAAVGHHARRSAPRSKLSMSSAAAACTKASCWPCWRIAIFPPPPQENKGTYDQAQAAYATTTVSDLPQEVQKAQLDAQAAKELLGRTAEDLQQPAGSFSARSDAAQGTRPGGSGPDQRAKPIRTGAKASGRAAWRWENNRR